MRFKTIIKSILIIILPFLSCSYAIANTSNLESFTPTQPSVLSRAAIIDALGWVKTNENRCGGYYIEPAISSTKNKESPDIVQITSDQFLFSFQGRSESDGKITIRRYGQEITASKAYLYRDSQTGKLNTIDLIGNVTLREPNSLVVGHRGRFNRQTKETALLNVLYRTPIYSSTDEWRQQHPTQEQIEQTHRVYHLSAWGQAAAFQQQNRQILIFDDASYSTCPPAQNVWKVKAKHIELNKETGRGEAYHARLYVKNVPIAYLPYLNFPIDNRRQTGFLAPAMGVSNTAGPYLTTPFYWNLAPNYDTTITPTILTKRGIQISDLFRYLTPQDNGSVVVAVLPVDQAFRDFQNSAKTNNNYITSTDPIVQANLRRLLNASTTRKSFYWRDETRFNEHWSATANYSYVSDDYYLRELNTSINEVTQNQLLQDAALLYKGPIWNFTAHSQSYQTLHPIDSSTPVQNQYSRYPQLILNGSYPNNILQYTHAEETSHVEYTINNELTHFNIIDTPGSNSKFPMGNRVNIQPGISYPLTLPYLYVTPRLQVAMTKYQLGDVINTQPKLPSRTLPIFDIASGLYFERDLGFANQSFIQTLEPQIYYTYIPYRNQSDLPVFDTNLNMLTYDQLFMYNRFSGYDRIGDANQIAVGLVSSFIEQDSGFEKIHLGLGQIYYFKNRRVTLCNPAQPLFCVEDPNTQKNKSPLSGVLTYNVNPAWKAEAYAIWNPFTNELDNQTLTVHYMPQERHIINFTYAFVRNGDTYPGGKINKTSNNLSQTDISAAWPLTDNWSGVGRWTQNLNRHNFQNLLSGVQYDACCWAIRLVMGREFIGYTANNTSQYNTVFFMQFAFKGLGNISSSDPTALLTSSISGYKNQFGQDF
jgi:LPS-assembly protein